jgi:Bacterial Ig-like domain (group 1)
MRFSSFKSWLAALVVLGLAACGGGGGGAGTPILGGGTGTTAASVSLTAANATLGDGGSTVLITAVVRDANNVAIPSAKVVWSTDAGSLTGASATTDSNGVATATFSATDAERGAGNATVTATSGAARGSTVVALQGTRSVVVSSSAANVGTDGGTVTITAVVRDSRNVVISGARVAWTSTAGSLSGQQSVTNASGVATATFAPTGINPGVTPTVTVTATSGLGAASAAGSVQLGVSPSTTTVELLASQPTVGTGGEQVTITAFVKDGNNLAKAGAPVTWSVDSGRISNQIGITNSSGTATAVLDAGSNKANRTALVTVSSGAAQQSLSIAVVNTKLAFSGASTLAVGSDMQLTITATDSKNIAIPGVQLALSSSLGNTVPATATTDAAGQAVIRYVATKSGTDSLMVSGAGTSQSVTVTVSGLEDELVFLSPAASSKIGVRQSQLLTLRYRKNGAPLAGATINLAATIGQLSQSSVTTDGSGQATVNVSSGFAGSSVVSASLAGSLVQAGLPLRFVATTPAKLVLQVTPSAVAPNLAGAKTNQASIVAKVTDADGNPVADAAVNFSQVADPSGGQLQQASAVTDGNGTATVQYVSGPESTASGAVRLAGTVASAPAISGSAVLTVNQSALFIALGTGNTIGNADSENYEKKWTVYVTDANGVRVTNVPVTVKVIPNYYAKGEMVWSDLAGQWIYNSYLECPNEDRNNLNGILDAGEDTNGDRMLTPGNVVALPSSTVTTDANGAATITLRYAELYAPWIGVRLTATAIVSGTESTAFRDFPLDRLAGDFTVKTLAPAGARSPFGIDTGTCANAR